MKFSVFLGVVAFGATAAAQAVEQRDVGVIQYAAKTITADFIDLERVINGTIAQLKVIESAYGSAASLARNQNNLTAAETLEIVRPFQDLQNQVLRTMNTVQSHKSEIAASSACKDITTQLSLVWFLGAGFFNTVGKLIPGNGQPLWKNLTDPINNGVWNTYQLINKECPVKN